MRDDPPRQQSNLFTYGTHISLRGPERRTARVSLALMLLVTAVVAALVLMSVVWLATADLVTLLSSLRDALLARLPHA